MYSEKVFDGIAFVGDVHFSAVHPSSRHETYPEEVVSKLDFVKNYCNDHNLCPVFLGDFFHRSAENNIFWLDKVFRVMGKFHVKPLVLAGNHDMDAHALKERCTLSLLDGASLAYVISKPQKLEVKVCDELFNIYAEPFGMEFPEVSSEEGLNLGISHRSFNYFSSIDGIEMVFNGHEHLRKEPFRVGKTLWNNIGSLVRTSSAEANQKPLIAVVSEGFSIENIEVPHLPKEKAFNISSLLKQDRNEIERMTVENATNQMIQGLKSFDGGHKKGDGQNILALIGESALALAERGELKKDEANQASVIIENVYHELLQGV